jgi:hypothetical protein
MRKTMSELDWVMLEDVSSRLEAEGIRSLLEAEGIRVELFQEAVGALFPVAVDSLGTTQIFVPKRKLRQARTWLKAYREGLPRAKVVPKKLKKV